MSKQSEAKIRQEYTVDSPKCSNCKHFSSSMKPINWMLAENQKLGHERYDLTQSQNQVETDFRCKVGGFAIKKTAFCKLHEAAQ